MNKDGFLSFAEFSAGIDSVMAMSGPIKEKFFSAMDSNHIGMIDYSSFLQMMQAKGVADVQQRTMKDSFDWENSVISSIKDWILQKKITVEEAFKCFDKDFDGVINKTDLAPHVGANLDVMHADTTRMRTTPKGLKPFVMTNLKTLTGLDTVVAFIEEKGMLKV